MKTANIIALHTQIREGILHTRPLHTGEIENILVNLKDGKTLEDKPQEVGIDVTIHACPYVNSSDLVPPEWEDWFHDEFGMNCDVSFGDSNRTLIDVTTYLNITNKGRGHVKKEEYDLWAEKIRTLGNTYIDLEN